MKDVLNEWTSAAERLGLTDPGGLYTGNQYTEMRKAFFCGFSSCLVKMKIEISELPEEKGVEALQTMLDECERFWENEVKIYNESRPN